MRSNTRYLALAALALGLAACTRRVVIVESPPAQQRAEGQNTRITLGVPPGHLPPEGMCRIWIPGRPPGRQARARSCDGIVAAAPAGSMILYRPGEDRRIIRVRYVDDRRAGVVIRIRIFDAETLAFVREERQ
ncbi:MAG TPA: hypothetical protein VNL18_08100 [Gemmatimonadales bacterium]|nr:hypothetical protein [Gemmatimonadales bacterium]